MSEQQDKTHEVDDAALQEMIAETTLTFSTNTVAVPARFRGVISLTPDAKGTWEYFTPSKLRSMTIWESTWIANNSAAYTIEGGNFILAPAPSGSPTAHLLYWQGLQALSDSNTTNTILTNNYDLFLYAGLAALYDYAEDLELEQKYLAKSAAVIAELNRESKLIRLGSNGGRKMGTSTP